MTQEESILNHQPRSMFSTWIGVVLLFAFFGLVALVIVRASPRGDTYETKRAEARMKKWADAQKENMSALTTYAWVDKTKGIARIPVEKAMQLTMAELAQKKPAPANPIATPETSPAAQTAASPAALGGSATPTPAATSSPAANPTTTPKPTSVSGVHSESHNQPAAAANPPSAPPNTQPGPSATPAGSPPSAAAKAPVSPTSSPTPAAPGTPLPVRGKTP